MAKSSRFSLVHLLLAALLVSGIVWAHKAEDLEDLEDLDSDGVTPAAADDDVYEEDSAWWGGEEEPSIAVDDKDVVVLSKSNYTDFVKKNRFVMVEFYAPWCGHCQSLAPEYAGAATELKGEVALAKVDATVEHELAQENDVQGYPTIYFYVDGAKKSYNGHRTGEEIVKWIKKRTGPPVTTVETKSEAETILANESPIAVAYLEDLKGGQADELAAAARQEDSVVFYQTSVPEVAEVFKLKGKKSPALVLLKKEHETTSYFDGDFQKNELESFVSTHKLPLIIVFSKENTSLIFENPIKKHLLLFASGDEFSKLSSSYQTAAKALQGKLVFVHVESTADDSKHILDYFGVQADKPKVVGYASEGQGQKFLLEKDITVDNLKAFGEDFLNDKLEPFYKSEPVPEKNDEDVKIVVGKNFDEIVLDESKDVLLEIYAPWCGHCQALEPIYNKLATRLREVKSLVIAKMDGTANEHPRAKSDGFPTLLFFPAGNKSFDPLPVDAERTVKAFYQFLKKNAAIPFTLPKSTKQAAETTTTSKQESSSTAASEEASDVKDEL